MRPVPSPGGSQGVWGVEDSPIDTCPRRAGQAMLDYLSGKTDTELDSATLGRIREISVMPEDDKKQVFVVLDALIRDYKARKTYAQ